MIPAAFEKALPLWGKGHEEEMNSSLFFFSSFEAGCFKIRITGSSFYRLFLDGEFLAYGPSRDAHGYYRVDELKVKSKRGRHVLIAEVSGYRCHSFYSLDEEPFLQMEVFGRKNLLLSSTGFDVRVFLNSTRFRKVTRFSYQRAFSESYRMSPSYMAFLRGEAFPFPELEPLVEEAKKLEGRIVDYPTYRRGFFAFAETGKCFIDETKKPYEDRYQVLDFLKIFPKNEWEIDSNAVASKLSYSLAPTDYPWLKKGEFVTFQSKVSLTGFTHLQLYVKEKATLYLLFDEVNVPDPKNPDLVGICFYRNTTHNCITYELEKGHYDLVSFEPYTMKYLRLCLLEGKVRVKHFGLIRYENPDVSLRFQFENPKINQILSAAENTFAQNALDLLTDCPSRERAGWLCDSFFSGQAEPLLTGKNLEEEAFLSAYAKCRKEGLPKGMVPMCYPADFPSKEFIPNWALWYILELSSYQKRNGPSEVIEESLDNVRGILEYFLPFENEDGLLENLQGWIFVEWSKANDADFISGVNFPSNMLYAEALCKAGELLSDPSLAQKGNELKKKIRPMAWNGEFFVDNALRDEDGDLHLTDHTTETCQYYALYFGILSPEENPDFFHKMVEEFGQARDAENVYPRVYKSNVLMGIILRLSILNRSGLPERVFEETVGYFSKMAELTGTLWEHDSVFASLNHCFTSYVCNLFLEANFGLEYVDEDHHRIHMHPKACYHNGYVSIPLQKGRMSLECKEGKLRIRKPKGYRVKWN